MPTPFTHLWITNRLLDDTAIPEVDRALLKAHIGATLVGGVIADARIPNRPREATHFYRYDRPMLDHPWRVMLAENPTLKHPTTSAQRAFVAAYVAHLAVDEYWSRYVLQPHFGNGQWGRGLSWRFYVLHFLLIHMDERDEAQLPPENAAQLRQCQPQAWLPFMPDSIIADWRDFIAEQLEGESQTLAIFGERIQTPAHEVRRLLDDSDWMQRELWNNIPLSLLAELEAEMYGFAREQIQVYLSEST